MKYLLAVLFFLLPLAQAHAAIAFDNSSASVASGGSYTVTSNVDNVVIINWDDTTSTATATIGGVSATALLNVELSGGACGAHYEHYFYLLGAPTGSITLSNSNSQAMGVVSYSGVAIGALDGSATITSANSVSVSSVASNAWIIAGMNGCSNTGGSGVATTVRVGSLNGFGFADSGTTVSPGSHTESFTYANTTAVLLSLAPFVASSPPTTFQQLLEWI